MSTDDTPSDAELLTMLANETARCRERMLATVQEVMATGSPEAVERAVVAAREFSAAHRRWFALANPGVDYASVFAGNGPPTSDLS